MDISILGGQLLGHGVDISLNVKSCLTLQHQI